MSSLSALGSSADHIPQSDAELRQSLIESDPVVDIDESGDLEKEAAPDPRLEREYTFPFHYRTKRGEDFRGNFTSRILSVRDRQRAGQLRAQFGGGQPIEAIDPLANDLNYMVAHMTFGLISRPKWADNLGDIADYKLIEELYAEVAAHEATFLG